MPQMMYRIGQEGADRVKAEIKAIGDTGENTEQRLAQAAARRASEVERLEGRLATARAAAAQIRARQESFTTGGAAALGSTEQIQRERAAAAARLRELAEADAQARQRVQALQMAYDPLYAAQVRYNRAVGEARTLHEQGRLSSQLYNQVVVQEKAVLDQATLANQRHGQSLAARRAGMQQLGFQIGDVTQQLSMGVSPLVVWGQQIGQVTQAIQLMTNRTTGFIGFIAGPWGAVLTAGITVLGFLIAGMREAEVQAGRNVRAQDLHRLSLQGLTQTIREQTEALREQLRTQQEVEAGRARAAQATIVDVNRRRNEIVGALAATMQVQRALEERLGSSSGRGAEALLGQLAQVRSQVARLRAQAAQLQRDEMVADEQRRLASIAESNRSIEGRLDRATAERNRATDAEAAIRREREQGLITQQQYEDRVFQLRERSRRQLEAIQAEERRARSDATSRDLLRPVSGAVLSQYGADRSMVPVNGRLVRRSHQGVDLRGNVGDPVLAPEGGVATVRNAPGGLGLYVEIRADSGARNLLAHLSAARVQSGQRVEAGQLVGLVGASGNARGGTPHLHWQRQVNGQWVDPMRGVGSSGAARAASDAEREAAQRLEQTRQMVTTLRRELDPGAAAAAAFAEQVANIQRLMADPQSGLGAEDGARWLAEARQREGRRLAESTSVMGVPLGEIIQAARAEQERRRGIMEQLGEQRTAGEDRLRLLRAEQDLMGQNESVRQRTLRLMEMELDLTRRFGPEYAAQVHALVEQAAAADELEQQIQRVRDGQRELQRVGESIIDEVFNIDNWDDWGEAGMRVLRMLAQELLTLAAINPLKNLLTGGNLPTASGLGGILGALFGGASALSGFGGIEASNLSFLSNLKVGAFASGTEHAPGGLAWLGENGRELVNLPRGSRVTPAAETRRLMAANDRAPVLQIVNHNDFRGADASTVAAIEARQQRFEDELAGQVVQIVADARGRFVLR